MSSLRRLWLPVLAGAVCVALAASRAWVCDDAYISYRYADNLVRGLGLVFNAGERVEAMTNLLWTLVAALGVALHIAPESWTMAGGLLCFAGTVALLLARGARQGVCLEARLLVPVAAAVAAAHVHLLDFATSGLETSAFTFLALAGYSTLVPADGQAVSRRRAVAAGLLFALAALTRPDGLLLLAVAGAVLLAGRDGRSLLALALGFLLLWGPVTRWRLDYYGDFFPNTYYAKSAGVAYWSQGLWYVALYFQRYWPLLLGPPLALVGILRMDRGHLRSVLLRASIVELAFVVVYSAYVARVGGDFMFARLLIPVAPFLLLLLERAVVIWLGDRPRAAVVATLALVALVGLWPAPRSSWQHGIADERAYYTQPEPSWAAQMDRDGEALRTAFAGLEVSMCFFGSQARLVYRSRVATAIDCEGGLTDPFLARMPLPGRGRVGHERWAPVGFLLRRGVHFAFQGRSVPGLDAAIPPVPVRIGPVAGRVVTWDPELFARLRDRGARIPDLPAYLDGYLARIEQVPPRQLAFEWARLKRFYFDRVQDPKREAAFRAHVDAAAEKGGR